MENSMEHNLQKLLMARIGELIVPKEGSPLDREEREACRRVVAGLIQSIDDKVIVQTKGLPLPYKAHLMKMKHGEEQFSRKWIIRHLKVGATILNVENNRLHVEGLAKTVLAGPDATCHVEDNRNNRYELTYYKAAAFDKLTAFGDVVLPGIGFKVDLPLAPGVKYTFVLVDGKGKKHRMDMLFGKFSRLSSAVSHPYFFENGFIVKYHNQGIKVYKLTLKSLFASELRVEKDLKASGKGYLAGLRRQAILLKLRKKKPLWLLFDRTNIAGDNAEALYRHMVSSKEKRPFDSFFVIDKKSRGARTLEDLPGIVDYCGKDYKLKFLLSDNIISSQWADWVFNPFGEDRDYMKDLYAFRFIYLRHGIMKNDMSYWAHKLRKNIAMTFASTREEQAAITLDTYGYEAGQVRLTGMPRYDLLRNEPQKIVSIMPTWRKYIDVETIPGRSERMYSEDFKETAYFHFYNDLINDPRIIRKMSEKGYMGKFYVHPLFEAQSGDFRGNDVIRVARGTADYKQVFRETSLLVTDYSSVDLDFSYLKKPVVYAQFDKEQFYSTHTYREGSFDSLKDSFGPVCADYESTVRWILSYLENDCVQEQTYRRNVDAFYEFTDGNNCKRVLETIL